jgi:hypothetical protein
MRKRSSLVSVKSKTLRQFDIKTFTGRYDFVEDRLRLDSVDSSNSKESIFLTRRLTDKIWPVVVKHLEEQTCEGVPTDIVQEIQQVRARQAHELVGEEKQVDPDPWAVSWLCRTVHLTKAGTGLIVTFTDDFSIEAKMLMSVDNLRVVLDIFKGLYDQAEWNVQAFPEWMQTSYEIDKNKMLLN